MKWLRVLFFTALALGLAAPAFAQVRSAILNDSEEPGSVIVFAKFIRGTVSVPTAPGVTTVAARSSFEVSVNCPTALAFCPEFQTIKVKFHWVCPGFKGFPFQFRCRENDFIRTVTVNGTLTFNPEGVNTFLTPTIVSGPTTAPPSPLCPRGFLVGYVINLFDQPIKFDGLVGNAVLREGPNSASSYLGLPIQASPNLIHGQPTDVNLDGNLDFDGTEYQAVTGTVKAPVRYERFFSPRIETHLTLYTLDVLSNRQNPPTVVDLNFFTAGEILHSTGIEFICWVEARLTAIDPNLHEGFMGFKGLVESENAFNANTGAPVTLLGIVETKERGSALAPAVGGIAREYSYNLFNRSDPVPTFFQPN